MHAKIEEFEYCVASCADHEAVMAKGVDAVDGIIVCRVSICGFVWFSGA